MMGNRTLIAALLLSIPSCAWGGEILLREGFERPPKLVGWTEEGGWFGGKIGPGEGMHVTDKVPAAAGRRCLQFDLKKGEKGSGGVFHRIKPCKRLHIRYYRMFEKDWEWPQGYGPHDVGIYAFQGPSLEHGPTSADLYALVDFTQDADTILRFGGSGNTKKIIREARCPRWNVSTPDKIEPMKWHCVEVMLKAAAPDEDDGVVKLWVNGKLVTEHHDVPLRSDRAPDLPFKWLLVGPYFHPTSPKDQIHWLDELVISTEYIGTLEQPGNQPPRARFSYVRDWGSMTATFDASRSADPDGQIAEYAWDFGDGASAAGKAVSHEYAMAGESIVTLKVADQRGGTHSTRRSIRVGPRVGSGQGLQGEYYRGTGLQGKPIVRIAKQIDFERKGWAGRFLLGEGVVGDVEQGDDFSCRWTGFLQPTHSEEYKLVFEMNEGGRLWFDGALVIDAWEKPEKWQSRTADVGELKAGAKYPIRIEHYRSKYAPNTWKSFRAKLYWESPATERELVPQTQLYLPQPFAIRPKRASSDSATGVSVTD
jgi:PKD repeat protein